jgi:serine/threonine protein kinase/WD40 repeat protein
VWAKAHATSWARDQTNCLLCVLAEHKDDRQVSKTGLHTLNQNSIMDNQSPHPRLLAWLDAVADHFELACRDGNQPEIGAIVEPALTEVRSRLENELSAIELEWQERRDKAGSKEPGTHTVVAVTGISQSRRQPPGGLSASASAARSNDENGAAFVEHLPTNRFPKLVGFEIIDEVGRGAHGVVYRARSKKLKRIVAIKMLSAGALAGSELRDRFEREAVVLASLNHPHIVQVFETGIADSLPYLVCEYVDGGSLRDGIRREPVAPRDAATFAAMLADAVQHAHEHSAVHRDLKPANILLADSGPSSSAIDAIAPTGSQRLSAIPKIADFGLAKLTSVPGARGPQPTRTGQFLGTFAYMAPEQAGDAGRAGPAADVYSLGVILYELLTGRPPFQGDDVGKLLKWIEFHDPLPPSKLRAGLPTDLETIALKCLEKSPSHRYATAKTLADDLRRYLADQPIEARPISWLERVWRWSGRNRRLRYGVISAVALMTLVIVGAVVLGERREKRMAKLQQLRQDSFPTDGWYKESLETIRELRTLWSAENLQGFAAGALSGPDAIPERELLHPNAQSMAFDSKGQRLLVGGSLESGEKSAADPPQPARIWDLRTGAAGTFSPIASPGPVTFTSNDTPLQLAVSPDDHHLLILWDLAANAERGRFRIREAPGEPVSELNQPTLALSANGRFIAASTALGHDEVTLVVWDVDSGQVRKRWPMRASAVAFSANERWLAAGTEEGEITVWSLPDCKPLAEHMTSGPAAITALRFGRDPVVRPKKAGRYGLVLAAGTGGGEITIWDLERSTHRSTCHGSDFAVYGLAFTSDGSTLASVGRAGARIWDVATGQGLLWLHEQNDSDYSHAVEFSPDEQRLIMAADYQRMPPPAPSRRGRVVVWRLEWHHGINMLRGLSSHIERAVFSLDDSTVSAISHNWEVGVWETKSGRLQHVFFAESGADSYVDNSALLLNSDGTRLFHSIGRRTEGRAALWDVRTGDELGRWVLPPGLVNQAGFRADGRLLHFQVETNDGRFLPDSAVDWKSTPRVCRIRELDKEQQHRVVATIENFPRQVSTAYMDPAAHWLVVNGLATEDVSDVRTSVFEVATGKALWPAADLRPGGAFPDAAFHTIILVPQAQHGPTRFLAIPEFKLLDLAGRTPVGWPVAVGPDLHLWFGERGGPDTGLTLFHDQHALPLVTFGFGARSRTPTISRTGKYALYGTERPALMLCDLEQVRAELRRLGLGW